MSEIIHLLDNPRLYESEGTADTSNAIARSYYDRGKEFFFRYNLADQERAIESFRKAVEIDPAYAQAHAMLATACQLRSLTDPGGNWIIEAERAVEAALRIAPLLSEAHSAHAGILRLQGCYREAIDSSFTAYELDPLSSRAAAKLGSRNQMVPESSMPRNATSL
jgi:Tfp pilus assembly protein PilF